MRRPLTILIILWNEMLEEEVPIERLKKCKYYNKSFDLIVRRETKIGWFELKIFDGFFEILISVWRDWGLIRNTDNHKQNKRWNIREMRSGVWEGVMKERINRRNMFEDSNKRWKNSRWVRMFRKLTVQLLIKYMLLFLLWCCIILLLNYCVETNCFPRLLDIIIKEFQ